MLCSGSGIVAFVNAKRELKTEAISNEQLETQDPSLYKRLQYAKEVLLTMMSGAAANVQSTFQQVLHQAASPRDSMSPSRQAHAFDMPTGSVTQRFIANE